MSMVGAKVRQACIDDIARLYTVEMEDCPKRRVTNAHQHKCGRRSNSIPSFLAATASSCITSSESSLRLSNWTQANRDEVSVESELEWSNGLSAVLRPS